MRKFRRMLTKNWLTLPAVIVLILLFITALFAPLIATHNPIRQDFVNLLGPPGAKHWLGTDELGRDLFSRVVYGARISITISLLAVGLGGVVGVSIGLIAGYFGGVAETLLMRFIDILLAFPGILLAILIAAVLGSGVVPVIIAVAVYSVPTFARVMRGSVLSVREREYVEAARATGARSPRILLKHVLLNSFGPILVYATLSMGGAILTAGALSFLGVGVAPPTPEWGAMINTGSNYMRQDPLVIIAPGAAIFVAILAFNILGDALRDVFDPKGP